MKQRTEIIPNIDLLRDHGVGENFTEWKKHLGINTNDGFCLRFKLNKNKLYYVASKHTTNIDSDTYTYIRKCILSDCLKIVVLEGVPFSKGLNPVLTNLVGEIGYAIKLIDSKKNNIDYIGVEANEGNILLKLTETFSVDDVYGFYFLRDRKFSYMTLKINEKEFRNNFIIQGKKYLDNIFIDKSWDADIWFEKIFNKPFKYNDLETMEYANPINNPNIITQKINFEYNQIRDKLNIKNLYQIMNDYDSVLYIMGQNHLYADFNILIDTFNKYEIVKLNKLDYYIGNTKYVFYGSDQNVNMLKPFFNKRINENVLIHATPHFYIAVSHTYYQNIDSCYDVIVSLYDLDKQVYILGKKTLESSMNVLWPVMKEQSINNSNSNEKYFYVYVLDAKDFHHIDGLGTLEVISSGPVKPIKRLRFKNKIIVKLFRKLGVKLFFRKCTD